MNRKLVALTIGALIGLALVETSYAEDMRISFKLDSHLTGGMFMGERWVETKTFHSTLQPGREGRVVVRVTVSPLAFDKESATGVTWVAVDEDLVSVSPCDNGVVILEVHGAGATSVTVSAGKRMIRLAIVATYDDRTDTIKVQITRQAVEDSKAVDVSARLSYVNRAVR